MWWRIARITLAIIISPLAGIIAVAVHAAVASLIFGGGAVTIQSNLEAFGLYGLVVAYPVTLFLGLPLHLILVRYTSGTIRVHALVGAALAFLIGFFLFDFVRGILAGEWTLLATYALVVVLPGAFVAATFALIAGPRGSESTTPITVSGH